MFGTPKRNKVVVIFTASDVVEIPCARCQGTRIAMENHNGTDKVHCLECGDTMVIQFDTNAEREAFITKYERVVEDE